MDKFNVKNFRIEEQLEILDSINCKKLNYKKERDLNEFLSNSLSSYEKYILLKSNLNVDNDDNLLIIKYINHFLFVISKTLNSNDLRFFIINILESKIMNHMCQDDNVIFVFSAIINRCISKLNFNDFKQVIDKIIENDNILNLFDEVNKTYILKDIHKQLIIIINNFNIDFNYEINLFLNDETRSNSVLLKKECKKLFKLIKILKLIKDSNIIFNLNKKSFNILEFNYYLKIKKINNLQQFLFDFIYNYINLFNISDNFISEFCSLEFNIKSRSNVILDLINIAELKLAPDIIGNLLIIILKNNIFIDSICDKNNFIDHQFYLLKEIIEFGIAKTSFEYKKKILTLIIEKKYIDKLMENNKMFFLNAMYNQLKFTLKENAIFFKNKEDTINIEYFENIFKQNDRNYKILNNLLISMLGNIEINKSFNDNKTSVKESCNEIPHNTGINENFARNYERIDLTFNSLRKVEPSSFINSSISTEKSTPRSFETLNNEKTVAKNANSQDNTIKDKSELIPNNSSEMSNIKKLLFRCVNNKNSTEIPSK